MPASAEFLIRQYILLTHSLLQIAEGEQDGELQPLLDEREIVLDRMEGLEMDEESKDQLQEALMLDERLCLALKERSLEVQKILIARVQGRRQLKGYSGAETRNTYGQQV